jgi:hypothetical protein
MAQEIRITVEEVLGILDGKAAVKKNVNGEQNVNGER